MRWILVFLLLYLIPLVVLFKNYNNFKRSCIYGSIYIVLVSTIVTTNMYMSSLNKIKEAMYYQSYALDEQNIEKYASNFDKDKKKDEKISDNDIDVKENGVSESTEVVEKDDRVNEGNIEEDNIEVENGKIEEVIPVARKREDKDVIIEFKKEIYNIETIALVSMRDCMPYTKNISESIKHLDSIEDDIKYAQKMCGEVISMYNDMDIPSLSKKEHTQVLYDARDDVKKAYELREKAMESAVKLIDTKNPKYIGKITQYLSLSDKHITNFKERISDLNDKII